MSDVFDDSPISLSAENILLERELSCISSSLSLGWFRSGVRVKRKRSGVLDRAWRSKSKTMHAEPGKHLDTSKQRQILLSIESSSELAGELGKPLGIGFSGVELILKSVELFDRLLGGFDAWPRGSGLLRWTFSGVVGGAGFCDAIFFSDFRLYNLIAKSMKKCTHRVIS